ncbi:MAG: selenide, water dikinase SelD [Lachnospiraceae bacterium]|nr:selenide, water dikinase SelD [Lachnospiraceae bacterium]
MDDIVFCKSGGCTAKLGAKALDRILSRLEKRPDPNLLVGFDSKDDGAVYKINDDTAFVTTLDFFPPMVEDPYLFGQIAAANAVSDIYAMGGAVKAALNIVCFPENYDMNILGKILQGGNDKVIEAGGVLVGGHSIADSDIKYGLSVTGLVNPNKIFRNDTPKEGDKLILTKPLGVGIIMAANRVGAASEETVKKATDSMKTLNKYAAEILKKYEIHACTDVTGFGFAVHLSEMLTDRFSAEIDFDSVPYFPEVPGFIEEFYLTGAAQKNRNCISEKMLFEGADTFIREEILYDAQTSGGLLASVSEKDAESIVNEMNNNGIPARIVGTVTKKQEYTVRVK